MTELRRWNIAAPCHAPELRRFHCLRKPARAFPWMSWQGIRVGYGSSEGNVVLRLGIRGESPDVQCFGTRNARSLQREFAGVRLGHLGNRHEGTGLGRISRMGRVCMAGASFPGHEFRSCRAGWKGSRRPVASGAIGDGLRSWFRKFLFETIETSDMDIDSDIADELEVPEVKEDGAIEFERRTDVAPEGDEVDAMLEDDARFFRWKMRNEVRSELRDLQDSGRDPDGKDWEDWLDDSWNQYQDNLAGRDDGWYQASSNWEKDGVPRDAPSKPERGMKRTIKELFFRIFEPEEEVVDDLQFEERVFRFTSRTTAKFVGVLIIVPWITDFLVHDFVLVPFLDTYVEKVPLAAQVFDVRESQKLKMIESIKLERQRLRFEAEIGKAPPLSDDELSEHIREEALELREEYRRENRQAFASIWSDFAAGLTILLLLILNPKQVAIMQLTGERLFTNISDTGKAFIIILLTDIFLGYHSESGWETVSEMVLEHYGFEVSQAAIYTFVAIVPVTIDACFKLWVFKFFRNLSPSASATFREMQRH
ncbi:protein DAY-LENGTH-DEPENDENT DELAYED-GREENING 1, chloroplastic [Physcomitrium patens]|uniref:Chloroplast envelope membrane protein n=1 Tax=Physcomitrium patens TaxID=3218 RepID=A0A2K1KMM0_PHYPA|nr:chloroplast envelope membrane protein-like [Physcomitrium patens]PNR55030.1 hypothetical protein PHYPA_005923 [Physcomitrium patens]|eukprot:XP_024374481.1 chloroplast envelope membrane protein-like [Physcomitrella patens]